jgi:hypothetical protein
MAISHVSKLYAVTDAKIAAVTADVSGGSTTYGSLIDVPGIKSVRIGGTVNTKELRGDNTLLDVNSTLESVTLEFEYAKLNLDAFAVLMGGAVTDSGTGSTEVATYNLLNTSTPSYFKFEGKTPTAGVDEVAGDGHIVLWKCMISAFPDFGLGEEDYETFTVSATATGRLSDAKWLSVVFNETAAVIA